MKERVWKNHEEKFKRNCAQLITEADTLVLVGDHSWGRSLTECEEDMRYIAALPGRKSLTRGNHDMFWDAKKTAALNERFAGKLFFLQNNYAAYQDFALVEEYTVLENVKIPLYFARKKKGSSNKLALDALEKVGMKELAKKPVNKLSGGQKQRVAIARAIVNNPSFILADEPTGALDTKTSAEIMALFKSLNDEGKTVIIITHDPTIAGSCQRQIEISDGKIIE